MRKASEEETHTGTYIKSENKILCRICCLLVWKFMNLNKSLMLLDGMVYKYRTFLKYTHKKEFIIFYVKKDVQKSLDPFFNFLKQFLSI